MDEQLAFNIYYYLLVGFIGNALIAWEFGRKGFFRVGLEGPKNKRINVALSLFVGMIVWQHVSNVKIPLTSWKDALVPFWGCTVLLIGYFSIPRSMRLYNRAKFLQETSNTDDWKSTDTKQNLEQIQNNFRLDKAESLYYKALEVQKRLGNEASNDRILAHHRKNIATVFVQLSLLEFQRRKFDAAKGMAREAIAITQSLLETLPNDQGSLRALSDAYFYLAEAEHGLGQIKSARTNYMNSLELEKKFGSLSDVDLVKSRLDELNLGRRI